MQFCFHIYSGGNTYANTRAVIVFSCYTSSMEIQKTHQLKPGTIVDMRFRIEGSLGEGGFGITYKGTNINTGERVAIKEFFNREYMGRASDGSGRTVLTDEDSENRCETEKKRFLREARIIRDFSDEPGLVSILDYFEDNDTAYIVMEYIDGITLREVVNEHGRMKPEDFFDRIRPLLFSLNKLHSAGIIHRDISPENIMQMDNGSFILIDFGSAGYISSATQTAASTYKDGFAPPEQYTAGTAPSAAIDIYGLCATAYFCLTGNTPIPSIQRALFDDLREVSSVVPSVPARISDMITKGLSLQPEDRQGSINELLAAIDDVYLSPEARASIRRRRTVKRACIITALLLLVSACISLFVPYHNDTPETAYVHFVWNDAETAVRMKDVLQKRLDVFAGKSNYTIACSSNEITIGLPVNLLHGRAPDDIAKYYLSAPYSSFSIYSTDAAGNAAGTLDIDTGQFISENKADFDSSDIDSIQAARGEIPVGRTSTADISHVELILSEDAASRASDLLSDYGRLLSFEVDGYISTEAYSAGNGRSIYIVDRYAVDQDQYDKMLACTLEVQENRKLSVDDSEGGDIYGIIASNISEQHSSFTSPSSLHSELIVDWSKKVAGSSSGSNQCTPDKLPVDSALLSFDIYYDPNTKDGRDCISAVKARLDALETPYAFGSDHFNKKIIVIKVPENAIMESELMLLGTSDRATVTNGYSSSSINTQFDDLQVLMDGSSGFVLTPQDTGIDEISRIIEQNERTGLDHIYLKYGDIPVAYEDTQQAKEALRNGKIVFSHLCTEGISSDIARSIQHTRFVKAVIEHDTGHFLEPYSFELHDNDGKYEGQGSYNSFKGISYTGLSALRDALNEKMGASGCQVSLSYDSTGSRLDVRSSAIPTEGFERTIGKCMNEILSGSSLYSNDAQANSIMMVFSNRDSRADTDYYYHTAIALLPALSGDDSDISDGVQYKVISSARAVKVNAYDPENPEVFDEPESLAASSRLVSALKEYEVEYYHTESTDADPAL